MSNVWTIAAAGTAAGTFNGAVCRWTVARALDSSNAVFFSVFAGGLFYRLVFLAVSVWSLRSEKYIIILAFVLPLILMQVVFEVVPVKTNGTKRNN
jgi:hypothetical protein